MRLSHTTRIIATTTKQGQCLFPSVDGHYSRAVFNHGNTVLYLHNMPGVLYTMKAILCVLVPTTKHCDNYIPAVFLELSFTLLWQCIQLPLSTSFLCVSKPVHLFLPVVMEVCVCTCVSTDTSNKSDSVCQTVVC